MSEANTRIQYVHIEVNTSVKHVIIYGPFDVVRQIDVSSKDVAQCETSDIANTRRMKVFGSDLMFIKAALVEEVLSQGFSLSASVSVTQDSLIFFRHVSC